MVVVALLSALAPKWIRIIPVQFWHSQSPHTQKNNATLPTRHPLPHAVAHPEADAAPRGELRPLGDPSRHDRLRCSAAAVAAIPAYPRHT
jgi:hypothetical protein